ncbi:MAG: hypothetical protein J6A49_07815 [Clostridia bacterium]|nr:hypothetical protein [Clostridia bacterium]
MRKNYSICGKTISIESPLPITEHENFNVFAVEEGNTDILITYNVVEKLPQIQGDTKLAGSGAFVSCEGKEVYRNNPMGVAEGALSCYNVEDTSRSKVFFTEQSYNVMSDFRYMWNSVSLSQLLLPFKVLLFHASYISFNDEAILFSADCGVGKSTQAELWRKHRGAEVINGDKAGVSVENGKVYAHGLPFCGTSGICKNRTLPLKAIVFLGQAPENKIRRVTGVEAIQSLLHNIYLDFLAPGEMQKCVDVLIELLNTIPVYRLDCTPDERAVETLAFELGVRSF